MCLIATAEIRALGILALTLVLRCPGTLICKDFHSLVVVAYVRIPTNSIQKVQNHDRWRMGSPIDRGRWYLNDFVCGELVTRHTLSGYARRPIRSTG
jgi:hypothetical protein